MELKTTAIAGSMESSDIMITISPKDAQGITIDLESSVEKQFGRRIRQVIEETLSKLGIQAAEVKAVDKGALDSTIMARTIAAVYRAAEQEDFDWKEITAWNA
ncbi:TPA: citrate lyase acyl carrier protein [Streptococcus suis]